MYTPHELAKALWTSCGLDPSQAVLNKTAGAVLNPEEIYALLAFIDSGASSPTAQACIAAFFKVSA